MNTHTKGRKGMEKIGKKTKKNPKQKGKYQ